MKDINEFRRESAHRRMPLCKLDTNAYSPAFSFRAIARQACGFWQSIHITLSKNSPAELQLTLGLDDGSLEALKLY